MDFWLAAAHHLAVFSLMAVFAAEAALVRPGMSGRDALRVQGIDLWYGVLAGLIVIIGVTRVYLGGKGVDFYTRNPWFWAKMTSFLGVGLLSVPPTIRYFAWRKLARADSAKGPSEAEVRSVRRFLLMQGALFFAIPVFAAAMARWQG